MDNEEIDLRPWLRAVFRHWKIVLSCMLASVILFASIALLQPRPNQASVALLIVPTNTQITLDQRFASRDATLLTNANFQRQALIGIATSDELVQRVADAQQIPVATPRDLDELRDKITINLQGDLIQISARAETQDEATALAAIWGDTYMRMVTEIYSRDGLLTSLIQSQLDDALARYQVEQQTLEAFLARRRIFEIEFQQRMLQAMVDGSIEAEKSLYTRYLQMTQQLDLILQDAETLRKQVATNTGDELANTLGLLALQSRANGATNLPIDVSLEAAQGLRTDPVTIAEIDRFVVIVREERDRITAETALIAERITQGQQGPVTLDPATRNRYQAQLAALRSEAEHVRAEERLLIQSRDTALSSVDILRRKLEEQRIAEVTPLISLRLVGVQAITPPSILLTLILYGSSGLLIGLLSGLGIVILMELLGQRRQQPQLTPPVAEPTPQNAIKPS